VDKRERAGTTIGTTRRKARPVSNYEFKWIRRPLGLSIIGAVGGAAVNYAFIEHFQDMARGHFVVRRLERTYGTKFIQAEYTRIVQEY
jgi:hypothetical protein